MKHHHYSSAGFLGGVAIGGELERDAFVYYFKGDPVVLGELPSSLGIGEMMGVLFGLVDTLFALFG